MATEISTELAKKIQAETGQNVYLCYQCVKCTSGCPLAEHFDLEPNQVMRMVQFGDESVLESKTIWTCASCLTCVSRCPKNVDLPRVMEALRQIAMERGATPMYATELRPDLVADAPQMAIIGGFRKFTA